MAQPALACVVDPDPLKAAHSKYSKIATLGQGSFGFVQLCKGRDASGREEYAAIKFLKRDTVNKYTAREIENHSQLCHPHIIRFKEVFLTQEYICISMEYASGGSLFQYVQKQGHLKEAIARWFYQQLIIGVDYCHRRGVANRDIKLENTLLQVVHGLPLPLLKICDFGYSKADFMSVAKSKVGTLTYMAPEVLVNRDGQYDGKVADIWSCGVMLYVMLYGRYPFNSPQGDPCAPKAAEVVNMLNKMMAMEYAIPHGVDVSPEGLDLLQRMLLPKPEERITMDQILAHPWFLANLPPEAATMNETYSKAPYPAGQQSLEEIRRLLDEAKATAHPHGLMLRTSGSGASGGASDGSSDAAAHQHQHRHGAAAAAVVPVGTLAYEDACIEDTIREEMAGLAVSSASDPSSAAGPAGASGGVGAGQQVAGAPGSANSAAGLNAGACGCIPSIVKPHNGTPQPV